jgi:putative SOS response-associated peptidase YedK
MEGPSERPDDLVMHDITTMPNEVCAPIHDRMPAILEHKDYARWLGEEPTEPPHLMMMLKPYLAATMEACR